MRTIFFQAARQAASPGDDRAGSARRFDRLGLRRALAVVTISMWATVNLLGTRGRAMQKNVGTEMKAMPIN
ncbi:MAG TPA: hypothetical protein VNI02_02255, partial [Blastocatellia bacterium]|nr:hypothetical protein [Blastocatellia bacterium]